MKQSEPALHEGISSQGDNEEVEDILCNPSSLSVVVALCCLLSGWNKEEESHCSLETVAATSDLHWVSSLVKTHTEKNPETEERGSTPRHLYRPVRSRVDRVNSAVGGLQCGCCLLWCGWPLQRHIALQDSDKTSWEVTKCPCGGHNTHTQG